MSERKRDSQGEIEPTQFSKPGDVYTLDDDLEPDWKTPAAGSLPAGGTTGEVLTKASDADGDADWEASGGGSTPVKIVDLGVVDLADVFNSGPLTLHTMAPGEFLAAIKFTDTDTVAPDSVPLPIGFGTVKSFGWNSFGAVTSSAPAQAIEVSALIANGWAYGPFSALDIGIPQDSLSQVLSAAAAGEIQASLFPKLIQYGASANVRVEAPAAWAALTAYDAPADNQFSTPGALQKCAIVANGTVWTNTGHSGPSGSLAPNFAGHAGGSVADGLTLPITGIDQGTQTVTIAGDETALFLPGSNFDISGSTGNDGTYTVISATLNAGNTDIVTGEELADPTVDGDVVSNHITWHDTAFAPITVGAVHVVAEIWILS